MTEDDWLRVLWLPLLVTIVGGLALAGILAIFSRTVRDKFWKPIGRRLRWLTTVRVTTVARQEALRESGRDEVRDAIAKERATPQHQPVWRVERVGTTDNVFSLIDSQGVSVWDVGISAPPDLFGFLGPSKVDGPLVERYVRFGGRPTREGRRSGVMFTVRYRLAEGGEWHEGKAWLDPAGPSQSRVGRIY